MKILVILPLLLLSFPSQGGSKILKKEQESYALTQVEGAWVTHHCQRDCLALKKPQLKAPSPHTSQPIRDFCERAQGQYLVVSDSLGLAEALCRFTDGSAILASDYFKKFKTK